MKNIKVAICQIMPVHDKDKNIKKALTMIDKAASNKAELVVLPEIFYYPYEINELKKIASTGEEVLEPFKKISEKFKIHVCTGSIACRSGDKIFNRSYLIDPKGKVILQYDKCHLFELNNPALTVKESDIFSTGIDINPVKTDLGTIGILICYDIRFPEAARRLALKGTEILIVPAAFNTITGPAHWDMFFRTRAVENQLFVLACSPALNKKSKYHAYGHSMAINPWGNVLSEAGSKETIIYAKLQAKDISETREKLPLLKHRREELY